MDVLGQYLQDITGYPLCAGQPRGSGVCRNRFIVDILCFDRRVEGHTGRLWTADRVPRKMGQLVVVDRSRAGVVAEAGCPGRDRGRLPWPLTMAFNAFGLGTRANPRDGPPQPPAQDTADSDGDAGLVFQE